MAVRHGRRVGLPSVRGVFMATAPAMLLGVSGAAHAFDASAFWSMDALRTVPLDVEIVSTKAENGYRVDELYFTGDLTPDGPNRIFCPFARPEQPTAPVPVVLWLHPGGGHGDAAGALWLAQTFRCAVLNLDWSGEFIQGPTNYTKWRGPTANPYASQCDVARDLKNTSFYHIIIACRRALDYAAQQPSVDASRVCCFSGSWGSYLSNLLAGVDDRVKYAYCGLGAGGFHEDSHSSVASSVNALPAELRREWIAAYDPASYAPHVTAAIFQEACANDWFFWLGDVVANYHALRGEKRILIRPNSNHGMGGPDLPAPLFAWPLYCLWGEKPFLDVVSGSLRSEGRRYTWQVKGGEASASTLYFSPGRVCWPARYWAAVPARKDDDHWTAELPEPLSVLAGEVFVNVLDAEGRAISSEPVSRPGLDPATQPGPLWRGGAIWDQVSGAAAWRPTGPANHAGPAKPKLELLPGGALRVGPGEGDNSFAVLTNSVVLASGRAALRQGLQLVVDGDGQPGRLTVSLQRNSGSTTELAYSAEVQYGGSSTIVRLPWSAFRAPDGSPPAAYPFDGLRLDGERTGELPLIVEAIGFLG